MIDGADDTPIAEGEVLELAGFPEDDAPSPIEGEEDEFPVIAFSDDPEEGEDETPLIKQLRQQVRDLSRKVNRRADEPEVSNDPEPVVPPIPQIEDFEYDTDRHSEAIKARDAARDAHAEWRHRQTERESKRQTAEQERARAIEQQRKSLGVSDYEARAAEVHDRMSEQQIAILVSGADNPAQLIYALGRSPSRLDQLAGETNLAKFAVMIGKMEKDIRVMKRKAPPPESRVTGATASTAVTNDSKELAKLEAEADRSGDRSKVIAYKRSMKRAA